MLNNTMFFLYTVLHVVPYSIVRYYPFLHKLKVKLSTLVISYAIMITIQATIFCTIMNIQTPDKMAFVEMYRSGMIVIYFTISCFVINDRFSKHALVFFMVMSSYGGIVLGLSNFLDARAAIKYGITTPFLVRNISLFILVLIFVPCSIYFFKKIIMPLLDRLDNSVWDNLCILHAVLFLSNFGATYNLDHNSTVRASYIFIRIGGSLSLFGSVTMLVNTLDKHKRSLQLEHDLDTLDRMMLIQQNQYKSLSKAIIDTRKERHNKRQHKIAISKFIRNNDKIGLFNFFADALMDLPDDDEIIYCEDSNINLILGHYITLAESNNIEVDVKVSFLQKNNTLYNIKSIDLWVMLGNMLENSIEACNRVVDMPKKIKIRFTLSNDTFIATIDNSYNGIIRINNNDIFYSSKEENRTGIGVESIKALCEKYNSLYKFTYDENYFYSSIMLNLNIESLDLAK